MRSKTLLSKKFFYILILLLPLNLGKHFVFISSYVWGILSDYLMPTIYIQDILVLSILFLWFFEKGFPSKETILCFLNRKSPQAIILFVCSLVFSLLLFRRFPSSLEIFLRIFIYSLLSFYISYEVVLEKDFKIILKLLSFGLILLSIVSILQFIKQGAVFNNYLFFGEQPYSSATWGVAKESVLGVTRVPAYGFFRHPNILGGFLSIVLIWVYAGLEIMKKEKGVLITSFCLGLVSLLLTFSYVAWAGFLTGLLSYLFIRYYKKINYEEKKKRILVIFLGMIFLVNIITPLFINFRSDSLNRRGSLLITSIKVIQKYPLFGVGPGNFVSFVEDFRFMQPVHNIFFLIFSEYGVFSLLLFICVLTLAVKKSLNLNYLFLFLITILQIIFEGSLDHYFWTIHQTLLLLWIVLGLVFTRRGAAEGR
jgi:hypothetical protein